MIMWFGVGTGSKIAMGVASCFFPIAISTAAGMRQIDAVLIRVGRSFRASTWQMIRCIYLPAMREPIVTGLRLGLGVAIIGTLLAETKLSNKGLGYLVIQAYALFDMPRMYALLILLFVLSIGVNALIGRLSRSPRGARRRHSGPLRVGAMCGGLVQRFPMGRRRTSGRRWRSGGGTLPALPASSAGDSRGNTVSRARLGSGHALRGGDVEPHVSLDVVDGDADACPVHDPERQLRRPVAALRRELHPPARFLVVLDGAVPVAQRHGVLVLRLHVAMSGRALEPFLLVRQAHRNAMAAPVHPGQFVFGHRVVGLRELPQVGKAGHRVSPPPGPRCCRIWMKLAACHARTPMPAMTTRMPVA